MNIAQIRDRGQVTIPKKIRQEAGINNDATVIITTEPGRIILEQVGITPYPIRGYTNTEIEQFIKDDQIDNTLRAKANKLLVQ